MKMFSARARAHIARAIAEETKTRRTRHVGELREWLTQRQVKHFNAVHVINFYADIPNSRMGQFTTIRTAIHTTIHQNTGYNLSDLLVMKKTASGIAAEFPSEPKYYEMWDLKVLLDHFKKTAVSERRAIDMRTRANILVRMSIAGRNSDVAHIHRPSIIWTEENVKFRLYKWKTQRHQSSRYSNYYTIRKVENPRICAYTVLKAYMAYHAEHYQTLGCEDVWLAYHGKATVKPATLAQCTRTQMKEAGIDELFGAATVRHATITFWRRNGLPLESVMDRTGHRSKALVLKFYDRSGFDLDLLADIVDDWSSDEED
jgi:hypothetical protein